MNATAAHHKKGKIEGAEEKRIVELSRLVVDGELTIGELSVRVGRHRAQVREILAKHNVDLSGARSARATSLRAL